jgi:hypothetical protein
MSTPPTDHLHVTDALIAEDIDAYLEQHQHKRMLRFITCGSVDDGKSTLIGRLLYDSKMIFEDQLEALKPIQRRFGTQGQEIDFALLVDGLAAEREQGITIDVAYRFFRNTEKRKFIVADCPGHEQYTRNMVTGASTADLRDPDRCTQGRAGPDPAAFVFVPPDRHQKYRAGGQQDGPVDYDQATFDAIVRRLPRLCERHRDREHHRDAHFRASRATTSPASRRTPRGIKGRP